MQALHYVVLHHTDIPNPHFDLMFETTPGSMLQTWRLSRFPIDQAAPVERLPDHRREYLTYQGRISGNRGVVVRIAEGTIQILGQSELELRIDLGVQPLLIQRSGANWIISKLSK